MIIIFSVVGGTLVILVLKCQSYFGKCEIKDGSLAGKILWRKKDDDKMSDTLGVISSEIVFYWDNYFNKLAILINISWMYICIYI